MSDAKMEDSFSDSSFEVVNPNRSHNGSNSNRNAPRNVAPSSGLDDATAGSRSFTDPPMDPEQADVTMADPPMDHKQPEIPSLDLIYKIKGCYRLLELYHETGSGGMVDKILIDQQHFRRLCNDLIPGSYQNITKVDFKKLDTSRLKLTGVYGSKLEIIALLIKIGAIDQDTASLMVSKSDEPGVNVPFLASGIYLVLDHFDPTSSLYEGLVIYWPEHSTWEDSASSAVTRNRVTMFRYLTQLTDQVACLAAAKDASSLVLAPSPVQNDDDDRSDDGMDRCYTFEVQETNEVAENVEYRPGFTMKSHLLQPSLPPQSLPVAEDEDMDKKIPNLLPRVIPSETRQAFLTIARAPGRMIEVYSHRQETLNAMHLKGILASLEYPIYLPQQMDRQLMDILLDHGLADRFPQEYQAWRAKNKENDEACEHESINLGSEIEAGITKELDKAARVLRSELTQYIIGRFRHLQPSDVSEEKQLNDEEKAFRDALDQDLIPKALKPDSFKDILNEEYKRVKGRFIAIEALLKQQEIAGEERDRLIKMISTDEDINKSSSDNSSPMALRALRKVFNATSFQFLTKFFTGGAFPVDIPTLLQLPINQDPQFLQRVQSLVNDQPQFCEAATRLISLSAQWARQRLNDVCNKELVNIQKMRILRARQKITDEIASKKRQLEQEALIVLKSGIEKGLASDTKQPGLTIESIQPVFQSRYPGKLEQFTLVSSKEIFEPDALKYMVHVLDFPEGDIHHLENNDAIDFVPRPRISFSTEFKIPLGNAIRHIQLIGKNKCFVIVDNPNAQKSDIYLFDLSTTMGAPKRPLQHGRLGPKFLVTIDESQRLLAVCSSVQPVITIYQFDEYFSNLHQRGEVDLRTWYEGAPVFEHLCFVSGSEELCLVESSRRARVFNLITEQFRPATLYLPHLVTSISSTPDGSCLLVLETERKDGPSSLRAFHWASFGSNNIGFPYDLGSCESTSFNLTSIRRRAIVYATMIDASGDLPELVSHRLQIFKKASEFQFRMDTTAHPSPSSVPSSTRSVLLDVWDDLWVKFPVDPAIQRNNLSAGGRKDPSFAFVIDNGHALAGTVRSYWKDLVSSFERATRKPTHGKLSNVSIEAMDLNDFVDTERRKSSQYLSGEWAVELLCLIPIHLAVTRDNRFVPLKDGIISMELERQLLGADVVTIVQNLSIGWYESVLTSYLANRPVKVVSSMGEQSTGKSYALNHLSGSSFAGSAMRTTEGVWLAVAPTKDCVYVMLDFEGVHSIERSSQEDLLLVLFNSALSNMILFRNNFAISRDITNLFSSFQSSSNVLDPAANPRLFNSKLMIIIRDVVNSDAKEVVREFQGKFSGIVAAEQQDNFISKLHRGKLDICPWPCIADSKFYSLFNGIRKQLEHAPVTYPSAVEFVQTMKTLMAKLKASDWGSLDANLIANRAAFLTATLPIALASGVADRSLPPEPLKNLDSDEVTDVGEDDGTLLGTKETNRDLARLELIRRFKTRNPRQFANDWLWFGGLNSFFEKLVDTRCRLVEEWIKVNISRFPLENPDIRRLQRELEGQIVELRANSALCGAACDSCFLSCLFIKRHDGPHDCHTAHACDQGCDHMVEHVNNELCGFKAGHDGPHLCDTGSHVCGEPCTLEGKRGCMGKCVKPAYHGDEGHLCAAKRHSCGASCSLDALKAGRQTYTCPGQCIIPHDQPHDRHECESAMTCPLKCMLCRRLCSIGDHFHGLEPGSDHLCGQEHPCDELCNSPGICDVQTAPLAIESTFVGTHETFQYTKYSQEARRLPCAIAIPPNLLKHDGAHSHSAALGPVFHFCNTVCPNCRYYCTLPLGHPQKFHETRHGNMDQTRWAIADQNASVELKGHKFASNDAGSPMLCNIVCSDMGRHTHIEFCRSGSMCQGGTDHQHLNARVEPQPEKPKDMVTHKSYWERLSFKDPYSHNLQEEFKLCDHECPGDEHKESASTPAHPSHCVLPLFHPPHLREHGPLGGVGYVTADGHSYTCKNPALMIQAFHIIFVIDRSGSMSYSDRRPLASTPSYSLISRTCNDRFGAVLSACYSFWTARHALTNSSTSASAGVRRDSYSLILFNERAQTIVENDLTSSPDQLLAKALRSQASGGTSFSSALELAQQVMERSWSTDRTPVIIFLSDGECSVPDASVYAVTRRAVVLGKALALHSVSFGPDGSSFYLKRMAEIAKEVHQAAPRDPLAPPGTPCSYSTAIDTIKLAETFLGIADSLRKPRASLMRA